MSRYEDGLINSVRHLPFGTTVQTMNRTKVALF